MKKYNPQKIEKKWQKVFETKKLFNVKSNAKKKKEYILVEFPYPSGDGLHVGHCRSYTGLDIISRKKRMQGKNVLFPIGWDAFGLPTENYAIKHGIHPTVATKKNTDTFRRQLKSLGFSFDWSREVNTTDPEYYKWTQWIFLQLFKNGLAYKDKIAINWCPSCKIGLANEEVVSGKCERCGATVEKKEKEQWMIKITKYADRLIKDLDNVNYLEKIKIQQRDWIGRSDGAELEFKISCGLPPAPPKGRGDGLWGDVPGYLTTDAKTWRLLQEEAVKMRKNPTKAEKKLWEKLRTNRDYHFRRQQIIDKFIVDFVCLSKKLVIEVDGDIHDSKKERDQERTKILENFGFKILRFRNEEILNNTDYVIKKIVSTLETLPFGKGEGWAVEDSVKVFTTRADTLFGCTFLVVAPEHDLIKKMKDKIINWQEVKQYIEESRNKSDLQRQDQKEKTGIEVKGIKAINPANKREIPIFVADYVMANYGTGAIMAVPAHDERDFEFAKKYNLEIIRVIANKEKVRSIVWRDISKEEFAKIGIDVIEEVEINHNGKKVVMSKVEFLENKIEEFEKLIREKMPIGVWNEYVGPSGIIFNFKDKDEKISRHILSSENWEEIDKLCYEFFHEKLVDNNWKPKNVWKWLAEAENSFYKDIIIHSEYGILENSENFSGMISQEARDKIIEFVGGKKSVNYKLRDWVFSRQHYWGEPIPLVFCEKCGWQAVLEKDLPVELPKVKNYQPTDNGESPLSAITKWVNVACPECGGAARRETDTMPNWAGSNWYFLAYTFTKNGKYNWNNKDIEYWMAPALRSPKGGGGVDWYNGGMEHTTLHLLYSRFIFKFLWDIGAVPKSIGSEPYMKRTSHGMVLGEGGIKMSKSKGNVINPDTVVKDFGADTLRIYEMFMGPFDQAIPWDTKGVIGSRRFLERIYNLVIKLSSYQVIKSEKNDELESLIQRTIKKVSEDIEEMRFNTAVSALMILVNAFSEEMQKNPASPRLRRASIRDLLLLLSPFAPHLAEELWQEMKFKGLACQQSWPKFDEKLVVEEKVLLIVQINGKVRDKIEAKSGLSQKEAEELVSNSEKIKTWLEGKAVRKVIYVPNKVINIVI